jgi:hypothetical protein
MLTTTRLFKEQPDFIKMHLRRNYCRNVNKQKVVKNYYYLKKDSEAERVFIFLDKNHAENAINNVIQLFRS